MHHWCDHITLNGDPVHRFVDAAPPPLSCENNKNDGGILVRRILVVKALGLFHVRKVGHVPLDWPLPFCRGRPLPRGRSETEALIDAARAWALPLKLDWVISFFLSLHS